MKEYEEAKREHNSRVTNAKNWKTGFGEATLRGLQNNDRGDVYALRDDDMNHPSHYSGNIVDKLQDSRFAYTLSSRPQGPIKVPNLNYVPPQDPQIYH